MTDDETWVEGDHANTLNRFDVGDTRTTHIVVEQASTLLAQHGRGHSLNNAMVDGGQIVVETFSVYPENGNGADIAAAKVECSPALTKVKSERGVHVTETTTAAFMAGQGSRGGGIGYEEEISPTLKAASSGTNQAPTMLQQMSVRRLTPVECERLMGLPDGWTAPEGVKAPDSKRYAACGDAIVTTVAFWIADRIRMIEEEEMNG
jgi:site-specific DNA-cytosine methylase